MLRGGAPASVIEGCDALLARGDTAENTAIAFHNRALAYVALGDFARAMSDLDQAIELNPRYAPALRDRGGGHALQGDYSRAIADLDQAFRLDPRDVLTLKNRALTTNLKVGTSEPSLTSIARSHWILAMPIH